MQSSDNIEPRLIERLYSGYSPDGVSYGIHEYPDGSRWLYCSISVKVSRLQEKVVRFPHEILRKAFAYRPVLSGVSVSLVRKRRSNPDDVHRFFLSLQEFDSVKRWESKDSHEYTTTINGETTTVRSICATVQPFRDMRCSD